MHFCQRMFFTHFQPLLIQQIKSHKWNPGSRSLLSDPDDHFSWVTSFRIVLIWLKPVFHQYLLPMVCTKLYFPQVSMYLNNFALFQIWQLLRTHVMQNHALMERPATTTQETQTLTSVYVLQGILISSVRQVSATII